MESKGKKIDLSQFVNEKTFIRKTEGYSFGTREECRELFIEAFNLVDQTIDKFEMLQEYEEIIDWLHNTEGKGLFMVGSNGRGKSTILMGVLPLLFRSVIGRVLTPVAAREFEVSYLKWAVCIDDIGQEDTKVDYGNRIDGVEFAISHCEDNLKLLIMTSNLKYKQIVARYGVRIEDRINRLCKTVVFNGKSYRK